MASENSNWTRRKFIVAGAVGVVAAPLLTTLPGFVSEAKAVEAAKPAVKAAPDFDRSKCMGCQACTILFSSSLAMNDRVCWCETAEAKPA